MRAIALKSKSNVTCIFFVHLGHTTNSRSLRRVGEFINYSASVKELSQNTEKSSSARVLFRSEDKIGSLTMTSS